MENHAEIKDKCDGLETRLDEIAANIRDLPFDYKLIEKYTDIDNDIHKLYEWYDGMKKMLKKYLEEKDIVENKLKELDTKTKFLNNTVQSLKLQEFSRDQHAYDY
jgi:archaellum component FlaC|tara:strand:+ start:9011 stop:9325 length:315 start_codon:yes stop_codon:yes gene_type:complete